MAPQKRRIKKAASLGRSVIDLTTDSDDAGSPPAKAKAVPASASNHKAKAKKEKRLARYRSSCPIPLRERFVRAMGQRMYLIEKTKVDLEAQNEVNSNNQLTHFWKFAMLGSTGNVYTCSLTEQPTCDCPDFCRRQDMCKHLMFVLLRACGLEMSNPLAYQKAYLPSEIQELNARIESRNNANDAWANAQVRNQFHQVVKGESVEENDSAMSKRQSLEHDCPICLEPLTDCSPSQVTFCKTTCGMNFHIRCLQQWKSASRGGKVTCPNCRAEEVTSPSKATTTEGYVNMGRLQGQSPDRDTSTYYSSYQGRRRGRGRW